VHHHPDVIKPSAILPGWTGMTSDDFAAALGVPVSIDNDANLAALGDLAGGPGSGRDPGGQRRRRTGRRAPGRGLQPAGAAAGRAGRGHE
jgi:hypothetical protein